MKYAALVLCLLIGQSASAVDWSPAKTRVIVISLAAFAGETPGNTSFSTSDRLDDPLVGQFLSLGVPLDNMLYLKDSRATKNTITKVVPYFLGLSQEDEMLIFYYSSHGGYDPKTGTHTYSAFDGSISIDWFVKSIESKFKGKQVMLFSDCCFSGGMVDLAKSRGESGTIDISYGALSTTGSCNVGYSGWRFTDLLRRAWSGDVAMDFDEDRSISFQELCIFAEYYMAFVAEGKPLHVTTGSFPWDLALSKVRRPANKNIGKRLLARDGNSWYKAEIVDTKGDQIRVHFTDKSRYAKYSWMTWDDVKALEYAIYKPGTRVLIKNGEGRWVPGTVLERFQNMHECRYDGRNSRYDEWISPSRIKPN
ncbi:MAG: caspase family protein [Verrucomicrobiaceae bacterium]|nr:caspase family protein [Verrucomicrobiaceae bacterium]